LNTKKKRGKENEWKRKKAEKTEQQNKKEEEKRKNRRRTEAEHKRNIRRKEEEKTCERERTIWFRTALYILQLLHFHIELTSYFRISRKSHTIRFEHRISEFQGCRRHPAHVHRS